MTSVATTSPHTARRGAGLFGALALGAAVALTQVQPLPAQELEQVERPISFHELAERVGPAVVNITTATTVAGNTGPQGLLPEGSPFEDFFDDFQNRGEGGPRRAMAQGSGFVISADGYIVTNNHVIENADEIEIEFSTPDGDTVLLPAEIVGTDPNTDIAVLKVEPEAPLPFVEFGDSNGETAEIGDWVMVVGNPLGIGFSVSAGIVSARNRSLQGTYDDYIQTDAAINRGNSGGPMFNLDGEVIGVVTAILSPDGRSIGVGFAMSSAVVTKVVDQLREFGETRRGWLGVRIQDVTPDMVDAIEGLTEASGALVTDVPAGPAQDGGMEAGDVILTFDGVEVEDTRELVTVVGNSPVGKDVLVLVLRNGEEIELTVTLGRREEAETVFPASNETEEQAEVQDVLGMTVSTVTPELAEQFGLEVETEGLIVTEVTADSEAQLKGILPGDLITEAGQQPVTEVADLSARMDEALEAGRKSLLLLIRRGGDPRFVALVIDEE